MVYTLSIKGKINGEAIDYTLTFYPAQLLVTGDANGGIYSGHSFSSDDRSR